MSGLRTQDNCPVSSSENVPKERRLTAEEENLHGNEFGPPWQQHLKFPQSAERRQDGDRTSISHERLEQHHNQMYGTQRQLGPHQQDQELAQKQGQLQGNSFKGNFQYRASSGFNQGNQSRQVVEPMEQNLTNRIFVDDPHDQKELEFRISEIQQMNEFNKNKLDQQVLNRQGQYSHRAGPITNQGLLSSTGQQQSY